MGSVDTGGDLILWEGCCWYGFPNCYVFPGFFKVKTICGEWMSCFLRLGTWLSTWGIQSNPCTDYNNIIMTLCWEWWKMFCFTALKRDSSVVNCVYLKYPMLFFTRNYVVLWLLQFVQLCMIVQLRYVYFNMYFSAFESN